MPMSLAFYAKIYSGSLLLLDIEMEAFCRK